MPNVHFLKELLDRPLTLPAGFPMVFQDAGGNMGIIETSDGYVIDQLRQSQSRGVGGVIEISQERYEEIKKKPFRGRTLKGDLRAAIRALPPSTSRPPEQRPARASVVEVEVGQPLIVPDSLPTTRKVSQVGAKKPATSTRLKVGDGE